MHIACQKRDGEVHQWLMRGADRMDRVEIGTTPWNDRAEGYMRWKQGMIWTGTHELVPTSLGHDTMYYEAKGDCNKQLMMRRGPYFVEMHRPPREGVTQQTDIIDRDSFLAIAQSAVTRIAEVNNVPNSGWGGKLVRREVGAAWQTPAYGPAAGPRLNAGQYELRVYRRSAQAGQDLWNARTETITLSITDAIERNIELWRAEKKFGIEIPVP